MPIQLWNGKILIVDGKIAVHADCCCEPVISPCVDCEGDFTGVKVSATFTNKDCESCSQFSIDALECPYGDNPNSPNYECCGYGKKGPFTNSCSGVAFNNASTDVYWEIYKDFQATPHYWMFIDLQYKADIASDFQSHVYVKDLGIEIPDCSADSGVAIRVDDCSDSEQWPEDGWCMTCLVYDESDYCIFPDTIDWSFYKDA